LPVAKIGDDITFAAKLLRNGSLVAIPTETVYGLAGNALNEKTIAQIFAVKRRPFFDPLIVHCQSVEMVRSIASFPSIAFERLAEAFWPGPLTLLLPRMAVIPDIVTSGLPTVGVRIPSHPVALSLLSQVSFPLAAPSANPFGYVSPTRSHHVFKQLGSLIPYILEGGPCSVGVESTIVGRDLAHKLVLYRPGAITREMLEDVSGEKVYCLPESHKETSMPAPGLLTSHYAPTKRLLLANSEQEARHFLQQQRKTGLITFGKTNDHLLPLASSNHTLSAEGNLEEAACQLFSVLRAIEDDPVDAVVVLPVPDTGLGVAINDRLKRASVKV
jgi:L-threonylcarbamoyladenylate synthase